MPRLAWSVTPLSIAHAVAIRTGDNHPTNATVPINSTLDRDPYLDYQPHFADSLPTQILLTGLVFSLTFVLFLFLLFTMRSHWPRARLNYALQLSGAVTLLSALIATLIVVMHTTYVKSREWPYMLDYVAVTLPLSQWSKGALISWYSLEALVSGIVNVCHIVIIFHTVADLTADHSYSILDTPISIIGGGPPHLLPSRCALFLLSA